MKLGNKLSLEDFKKIVIDSRKLEIPHELWYKAKKSNQYLNKMISSKKAFYGINTGFGKLANTRIDKKDLNKLQENLILNHASGVGDDLPLSVVKGAILLRISCFLKGMSGVRKGIPQMLQNMINKDLIPAVPEKVSVGASGDLAPPAHLSLVFLGRDYAYLNGKGMNGSRALEKINLKPLKLKAKEGLFIKMVPEYKCDREHYKDIENVKNFLLKRELCE